MAAVAVVPHHLRDSAVALARDAIGWLTERGHEVRVPASDAAQCGLEQWSCPDDELSRGLALAVSLGGDGTMLRTVELVARDDVPVLGINVGHLGYLSEVEPAGALAALEAFFAGNHAVVERMTLAVALVQRGKPPVGLLALNEAVLEKCSSGHTVRIAATIDGEPFTTYVADGLIVATPTGSTAYSFSARGPIVSPRHKALVLTPVSPHMLFDRSLVLDASENVHLEVLDGRPAALLVDGREVAVLGEGDNVTCSAGDHPALLVSYGTHHFHRVLKAKFGLEDR